MINYGPFPVGTLCLCVRCVHAHRIGQQCVVTMLGEPSYNYDYMVTFRDGESYSGNWAGKHIIALQRPSDKDSAEHTENESRELVYVRI